MMTWKRVISSTSLIGCRNALCGGLQGAKEIEHPGIMRKIVEQLPLTMQKWCAVYLILEYGGRTSPFNLVDFIYREVDIMSHPLLARYLFSTQGMQREGKSWKNDDKFKMPIRDQAKARI